MGGKSSSATTGYWYPLIFQHCLGLSADALLEVRGGKKPAWRGELTASGTITINAPNLWGGEKDQGGIVGAMGVSFGEAVAVPNPYLVANLTASVASEYNDFGGAGSSLNPSPTPVAGSRVSAWRGFTTVTWKGGRWGANNPYPQVASYKLRRIRAAMKEVGDWYTEKAAVVMVPGGVFIEDLAFPATLASTGSYAGFVLTGGFTAEDTLIVDKPAGLTYKAWSYWAADSEPDAAGRPWTNNFMVTDGHGTVRRYWGGEVEENGAASLRFATADEADAAFSRQYVLLNGSDTYTFWLDDTPPADNRGGLSIRVYKSGLIAINPAHWLYYLHTHEAVGREPIDNMNDASWRAAADTLYAECFGICVEYDPDQESLEEHRQRIGKLIGGSVNRGTDGQLYLDLARGDYDIDDLPILTDDDVLDFKELPSVLDGVVNSVSVKYFDPERKETIVTPPDVDLALVDSFGLTHQVNEYSEIPVASLAARVARRDRLASTTPTRALELATTRTPYDWRPNTYFRAQLPKRGIADMVFVLGEKQSGTLRSGAIKIKAVQDIYNLPASAFVEVDPGGSTAPVGVAQAITLQRAFEAPYIEAVQRLSRADLAVLPEDAGYLQAVAADLVGQRDYTMMVADAGGEYVEAGNGVWCPVAETVAAYGRTETVLSLAGAIGLAEVPLGSAGLWDDEIVRVDDIDNDAGTLTVGRACADTVPAKHAAGSRVWFYDNGAAADSTEYTDGETVDVKLLSNTGSQQLALGAATAMSVTFAQRLARPYPPAKVRINGEADPSYLFGELAVEWAHRDRLLQADQLVDTEAATIGPEAGTTYTMRTYVNNVLDDTQTGIAGTSATVEPSGDGRVRIEIESDRDGLTSWQAQVREFAYTTIERTPLLSAGGDPITASNGDPIYME